MQRFLITGKITTSFDGIGEIQSADITVFSRIGEDLQQLVERVENQFSTRSCEASIVVNYVYGWEDGNLPQ